MTTILLKNIDLIFFFYGLAFMALGLVIFSQMRGITRSDFSLVETLPFLAWFGVIHGGHELMVMFAFIRGETRFLNVVAAALLAVSYLLLLAFGYTLINAGKRALLGLWFPVLILLFFLGLPVFVQGDSLRVWMISTRYFLGFTGGFLATVGLLLFYQRESKRMSEMSVGKYLVAAAGFFGLYAFVAGLVVPPAAFFPASVINESAFISRLLIPVQLIRAFSAIGLTWAFWNTLDIFNLERDAKEERAASALRQARDELEERVKIRTSELSNANARLEESEDRFRSVVETAASIIVVLAPDHRILEFNPEAERIFDAKREEVLGQDYFEQFVPPDLREPISIDMEKVMRGIPSRGFENVIRGADGQERTLAWDVNRLYPDDGKPRGVVAVGQDITRRKQAKQLSDALNDINTLLNSTLDFAEIIGAVLERSTEAIGCDASAVLLREEADWICRYVFGLPEVALGQSLSPVKASYAETVTKNGLVLVVNDSREVPEAKEAFLVELGMRSLLSAPLVLGETRIGMIDFGVATRLIMFSEEQIDFVGKLARSLSLAIENARLYSTQRNIANTLQETLLTMPEKIEGIDFDHIYRSAPRETGTAGGDFYDLFELEHDKVGIIIGDVSGKGLEAAALTSLVKNTARAYAYQDNSPAKIVSLTNDVILKSSPARIFVTVFFGILDVRTGVLRYCSAGHPRGVIRRKTSEVLLMETSSPVIGIFSNLRYADERTTLQVGDTLLLYTDGVIEARCEDEFYGEERLVERLRGLTAPGAKDLPQLIFDDVREYSRCTLVDDLAILSVALRDEPATERARRLA